MTCCGRGLRSGGGAGARGAVAVGPGGLCEWRRVPAGRESVRRALRRKGRPSGTGCAPRAPRVRRPTAPRRAGARGPSGERGRSLFLQAVAPRSCQKIRRGWKLATGEARRAGRAAGAGHAPEGPAHGASFLRVARAVECQPSYFKPFTEENPGPNRRQLLALPLQSFLWTRGATAERPRGWKSGSAPGGGRACRGPGGQTGEGQRGGGGGEVSPVRSQNPALPVAPARVRLRASHPPTPRLSPPDAGAHARQRGPLPRDGRRNECPQTLSGKASPAAAPEDRGLRPAKQCRH